MYIHEVKISDNGKVKAIIIKNKKSEMNKDNPDDNLEICKEYLRKNMKEFNDKNVVIGGIRVITVETKKI